MTEKIRFGIVGVGWRADFFLRIAHLMPELFEVICVQARNPDRGASITQTWDVPTVRTLPELLTHTAMHFVVVSVPQPVAPQVIEAVATQGWPVLTETPPAQTVEDLTHLYSLVQKGARIQVAEQYQFQPLHAARIHLAQSGKLGQVSQAQISAAHGYHGISLLRRFLNVGFENVEIHAHVIESDLIASRGRVDPPPPDTLIRSRQVLAFLRFASGRVGVFDFAGDQYFSWVRTPRVLVRGTHGEINQTEMHYLVDSQTPIHVNLRRVDTGHDGNLEGFYHKGILAGNEWSYHNPVPKGRLADDEIAVATCLLRMAAYVKTGQEFYDLAEGAQDQYLSLLMDQAVSTGQPMNAIPQAWSL